MSNKSFFQLYEANPALFMQMLKAVNYILGNRISNNQDAQNLISKSGIEVIHKPELTSENGKPVHGTFYFSPIDNHPIIEINDLQSPDQKTYTLYHELGHKVNNHETDADSEQMNQYEYEANIFAAFAFLLTQENQNKSFEEMIEQNPEIGNVIHDFIRAAIVLFQHPILKFIVRLSKIPIIDRVIDFFFNIFTKFLVFIVSPMVFAHE